MSILEVKLSWSNLGGTFESQDGRTFKATATEGWQVTHSADATIDEVLFASGLPQIGDRFQSSYLVCKRQGYSNRISPNYTIVTINYEGQIGSDGNGKPDPNQSPINNPPVIDWSDEATNESMDEDADGKAIATFNGEPIDGITMELSDPVLVVQKNFASYSPHLIHLYRRAVNSDTFADFPPGTARLIAAPAKLMGTVNNLYWQVTARFKFRYPYNTTAERAWYARVRHEGFLVRNSAALSDVSIAMDNPETTGEPARPVVKPVLLTENGYRLPDGDDPHWLEFRRYEPLPFNALGFL